MVGYISVFILAKYLCLILDHYSGLVMEHKLCFLVNNKLYLIADYKLCFLITYMSIVMIEVRFIVRSLRLVSFVGICTGCMFPPM